MHNIIQDLRFALRGWARTPGFAVAAIATLALGIGANTAIFRVVSGVLLRGRPEPYPTELRFVTPGYFSAMGIPLSAGREFSAHDGPATQRVILVNQALARQYFQGEDPVGRTTDRGLIIGVVGDVHQEMLNVPAIPETYNAVAQNFAQMRSHGSTLVVRGSGPVAALGGRDPCGRP